MNAISYVEILKQTLLPSVEDLFHGDPYRFMQDNDPSIHLDLQKHSLLKMGYIGRKHQLSLQISTQLRTFGMS